jgi:hypothetical protein
MSIRRFKDIMEEMWELNEEAMEIVDELGDASIAARANMYWFAHTMGAIEKERSQFLGGSMHDMAATLEELEERDG